MSNTNRVSVMDMKSGERLEMIQARLGRRYLRERLFRLAGACSILIALCMLAMMFYTIISSGYTAFQQTWIHIDVTFDQDEMGIYDTDSEEEFSRADYGILVKNALREMFPDVKNRQQKSRLYSLASPGAAFQLRTMLMADRSLLGKTVPVWVTADDDLDMFMKGHIGRDVAESERRLKDDQLSWVDTLLKDGRIEKRFNKTFFTSGDSREPELAGIMGAVMGSLYTMLVTLALSFPLGVATAIYLEEFAPENLFTDIIEVNINNLAAVPSIVFGLLGLAVFLNFMGLPRSAPVVGGLVLTLMTLPTIIIASRSAMKAVPPSIRDAALGVGASKMQAVMHHVVPLALPGMLTGTIIGMARALGETAPLLMIGMVAFIVDIPAGVMDKATVLPVQIYLWADSPERAFVEKTSAATMVLLGFLILMNAVAVMLRKKFEVRW